ncbi:MAG TPA: hypothetical protein VJP83_17500, partial [Terriglobales bacterium]|nr:hypothetical protein [Terriglobales bacterium]
FLSRNADILEELMGGRARHPADSQREAGAIKRLPNPARPVIEDAAQALRNLAESLETVTPPWEDLERRLTVMEEKLFAALLAATPDDELVAVRAQADRELAPYRRKMPAAQIEQLHKQFVHKRLMEEYGVPRLSLFYM